MTRAIIDKNISFFSENCAYSGVKKTAEKVKKDIELVVGHFPSDWNEEHTTENIIIYGTLGKSKVLDQLEKDGKADFTCIRGKWEVYSFSVVERPMNGVENAIIIAGSDKRGTIYGLYHLSEVIGVSPLVNWNHVWPAKKERIEITDKDTFISKVPSVKYRGFFINDEWPAFGTWATEHFGGINAECYDRVFELLLRLKGNYLWPAMWRSDFSLDGPGLESAELADEYGVVMSTSHHEPCMRSGEEYRKVRGEGSPYGDAWNFRTNEEGITRFWKDGLERNKNFENVITLGMRGECDTPIMRDYTLEQNIQLLRDVLKTQNNLIREVINPDLSQVPRQMVFFTEVEEFFYGNKDTKGLMGDPELDGVTLMLSDNNHGSTRTLPSKEMRDHNGGYGMYYHMDMHGGAHSFQWIGTTYLPKLWEEMTMAYEYGVREIWVTNIGDIGAQEFGLSYFLDLAYDIDRWGGEDAEITQEYTQKWVDMQFSSFLCKDDREKLVDVIWDYTQLLARRKHEVMNDKVYHPLHYGEASEVLRLSQSIMDRCEDIKQRCPDANMASYLSLLYYPACGTANLMKLWILSGRNKLYAKQNRREANVLAEEVDKCLTEDKRLVAEYQAVDDRYFYGFGLSEHIGFTTWCDEDNKYPLLTYAHLEDQPRMILARCTDEAYLTGDFYRDKPQIWNDALRQDVDKITFDIACGSNSPVVYQIKTECPWLTFSKRQGVVSYTDTIELTIHKELFTGKQRGTFTVENVGYGVATIIIEAENNPNITPDVFIESNQCIAMEASHYQKKQDVSEGGFHILSPYGRTGSAIKVYPVTEDYYEEQNRPYVEYHFITQKAGKYHIQFYMAATTPVVFERIQFIGYSMNEEPVNIINTVKEPERPFFYSKQWSEEAFNNCKLTEALVTCKEGLNILRFYGMSPAIVLERIVLYSDEITLPQSYLGPTESYRRRRELI